MQRFGSIIVSLYLIFTTSGPSTLVQAHSSCRSSLLFHIPLSFFLSKQQSTNTPKELPWLGGCGEVFVVSTYVSEYIRTLQG